VFVLHVLVRPRLRSCLWLSHFIDVRQLKEQKRARAPPPPSSSSPLPPRVVELHPCVFRLDAHIPQSLNSPLVPCLYLCYRMRTRGVAGFEYNCGKEPACSLICSCPSQMLVFAVIRALLARSTPISEAILSAGLYLRAAHCPQSKGVGQWQLKHAMQGVVL
jgi:hypothetical protein